VLITNGKLHGYSLGTKIDVERRNGPCLRYSVEFGSIKASYVKVFFLSFYHFTLCTSCTIFILNK